MLKKIGKLFLIIICFLMFISFPKAKTLKQLKDELARDERNKAELIRKSKEIQGKIDSMNAKLKDLEVEINSNEDKIKKSKEDIEILNTEISNKKVEIDNLLSFFQISNEDNIYMEYVFQAKSLSDLLYRQTIVEQLTKYNNELIDDMYKMIEQNKQLQKDLSKQIKDSENSISTLEKLLKEYGLDMNDLDEEKRDIEADIKARKLEVKGYEKTYKENGCKETVDLSACVKVPKSTNFVRPLVKGVITSEYGMRYHPTRKVYTMHNGVDIGGNSTGTKVYPSAPGRVNKIVKKSSCGGNMVYIQHSVNGKQYRTVYMHLHSIKVKVDDIVTLNTIIGTVGGGESYDGCSTGPHLHFGFLKGWEGYTYYNPRNYVNFPKYGVYFKSRY
ncbi:MAG: peptidoglycan DD-metalloendopeptidase family protein [Bacilli bacterium]|nr:peptidoglycan DD-metalloendopeptidase family protein [Bacilli bacterium]